MRAVQSGTGARGFAALALLLSALSAGAQAPAGLVQVGSIALPNVEGRIDHLAIDLGGARLFVAALGNGTVEVVDLHAQAVVHRIDGLEEPQGVFYSESSRRLYVTSAGSGRCDVFDGTSFRVVQQLDLGGDADNVHLDSASGQLVVSAGNGISILGLPDGRRVAMVGLPGHPEGFALEPSGARAFVNVPLPSKAVFVLDLARRAVLATWSLGGPTANLFSNFPMSLDTKDGRLFVGTRVPAGLKVLDTSTGKLVADVGTDGDDDDLFYDTSRRRVYASCGQGFIDVFQQSDLDHYAPLARVPTAAGARTSLWVPEMDRLFVAVPRRGSQPAEIRIFEAQ